MTDQHPAPDAADLEVGAAADHAFLGTRQVADGRFEVPVARRLINPVGGLYGGAGIALATLAAETTSGRPLRWITCQFTDTAAEGEMLDLAVQVDKVGKRASQLHVVGAVGDRTVFRALAATGEARADVPAGAWVAMPEVPDPDDCDELPMRAFVAADGTSLDTFERRMAHGPAIRDVLQDQPREPGFRMAFWARMADGGDAGTAPMLAWIADFVPMSVAAGLAAAVAGKSLDNTLRMVEPRPAEWVLVDLRPTAASDGYAYGDVHLWSPDGHLLATASQTAVLRHWTR